MLLEIWKNKNKNKLHWECKKLAALESDLAIANNVKHRVTM